MEDSSLPLEAGAVLLVAGEPLDKSLNTLASGELGAMCRRPEPT